MSKYQYRQSDIYLPGTEIPANRLGIEDGELLHAIEAELLDQASQLFLDELSPDTRFDEDYFRGLHRRTFESLYPWAGDYRTEDMSKGGSLFCLGRRVPDESQRIFRALEAEDFLRGARDWHTTQFAERLAYFQGELIALHPFYELNGRMTRLLFDLIAISNGYAPVDYSRALQADAAGNNAYIRASIACVRYADIRPLEQLVLAGLSRLDTN